jgi:hypothetical protein
MKQRVELDDGDLSVLEILDDIVWFGEFIRSSDEEVETELEKKSGEWHFDNYQKSMLLDPSPYLSVCTGRSTGKTVSMETRLVHSLISNKYKRASANEVLLVVQNKAQLEPIFLRLAQMFRRHPLLKYFIDRFSVNFSNHEITLLNGSMVRCRIIGSTADSNIIGLHVPCIFVDEGQVLSYSAWNSLMQCLMASDENFMLWVSGVPNGLREKNVLYECDQLDDKFSKHRVSRLISRRYKEEQNERDLKQYGGKEGDDYMHLVLGEHGTPAFSVFDRKLMKIEDYPVTYSIFNNFNWEECGGRFYDVMKAPEPPANDLIVCGIDAGFSNDPSILTILYLYHNIWRELARYELRRIKYPNQAKIIDWLDNIYRFNMITLDAGSSGLALGQIMQEEEDYKYKNFSKRLVMVDFQGGVVTGFDDEGKEIKDRVRKFTIQTLQKWTQNDQIIAFSKQDDDMISELERVGFTRDMLGQPKYFVYSPQGGQRGEDHILASLLTWVYGYYYNYFSPEKPKTRGKLSDLVKGGWNAR